MVVPQHNDAIGELLGSAAQPPLPEEVKPWQRRVRWALVAIPALALLIVTAFWLEYRSRHVISKNAAVRGHIAEIGTRVGGVIRAVNVDDGDRVTAGQVLVQMGDRHLLADAEEARAEVAALERTISLERATVQMERAQAEQQGPEREATVAAARANAEAARIEADEARRHHAMQEGLHRQGGLVATDVLRNAESLLHAAEARQAEAEARAVAAERTALLDARLAANATTIRERRIGVLEADLSAAQARLARVEADIASSEIRAPREGAIVHRIVQPGEAVAAGQPVLSMLLGDELWVEAWIDEDDIGAVRLGSKAAVTLQSLDGREFTGRVQRIGLSTDLEIPESEVPQPRFSRMNGAPVVGVRIRLEQPPPDLVPGLSAVVAIQKPDEPS